MVDNPVVEIIKKINSFNLTNLDQFITSYNLIMEYFSTLPINLPPACCVQLLAIDKIDANNYNPNTMASPECKLLTFSIENDGMTMPILVSKTKSERYIIVDGFHRFQLLKSNPQLQSILGYIPAAIINKDADSCISSSVRHNIARGSHQVELTAKLVMQLKDKNWSNKRLCSELGMDNDELLRMQQITGLAMAFKHDDFSQAWE